MSYDFGLSGLPPPPASFKLGANDENGRARRSRRARQVLLFESDGAAAIPAEIPVFACESCTRTLLTEIGLGVHIRRKHLEVANAVINIERQKAN